MNYWEWNKTYVQTAREPRKEIAKWSKSMVKQPIPYSYNY